MNIVINRINEHLRRLSPAHKTLANYILNNPDQVESMTARDLAKRTHNVPSTVISFSKKIGFKGFNELKFQYLNDEQNNHSINEEIIYSFKKAEQVTKNQAFIDAVQLLISARKIFIMAFQMSQIPAKDFYFRMRKIEPAKMIFFDSYADQFRMASLMEDKDVILIVSNSGESDEILDIERELSKKNCRQILVTNGVNSSLAKYATIELSIGYLEENPILFKEAPTTARYALIYLLEKLYLNILHANYDESFQRIKETSQFFKY